VRQPQALGRRLHRPACLRVKSSSADAYMILLGYPTEIQGKRWRDQPFLLENRGNLPFFSEFRVSNPQSKTGYLVAIRGRNAGDNHCSCPDYATNELGTCKHIEFVLARLEKQRGAKAAFAQGWRPAFSEI
jgi:hypothetical protein